MTTFRLSQIENGLVREKAIPTIGYIGKMPEIVAIPEGWNSARAEQESKEFYLDADEVKARLKNAFHAYSMRQVVEPPSWEDMAQAICANPVEVLKVKI